MRLPEFSYLEPESIAEACELLESSDALPLAGGTDLLVSMKYKLQQPAGLVDIKRLSDLALIQELPSGEISLGALATLRAIERSTIVNERIPLLATSARLVGTPQIRNKATLGGNICLNTRCWYYNIPSFSRKTRELCNKRGGSVCHVVPGEKHGRCYSLFSADTVPALMALDARVKISSAQDSRIIALRELYTGEGVNPIALHRGELVTEVLVTPPPSGASGCYLKLRERGALDFPILGIASVLIPGEDGLTCRRARLALTGVASGPIEATCAEAFLENKPLTPEVTNEAVNLVGEQIRVYSVNGISARYKRSMIAELTSKALSQGKPSTNHAWDDRT